MSRMAEARTFAHQRLASAAADEPLDEGEAADELHDVVIPRAIGREDEDGEGRRHPRRQQHTVDTAQCIVRKRDEAMARRREVRAGIGDVR